MKSLFAGRRSRAQRELAVEYRRQNLRLMPFVVTMLCLIMPAFAVLDYFLVGASAGAQIRNYFVLGDLTVFAVCFVLFVAVGLSRRGLRRWVLPAFLVAGYSLIVCQLVLLFLNPATGTPYVLVLLIFSFAMLVHMQPRVALLNLAVIFALSCALFIAGEYESQAIVPSLIGVIVFSVAAVFYRDRLLRQTIESNRKTRILAATVRQLNILKSRQDGDYFLTSRLIEPLTGSDVASPHLKIEVVTRQMKAFRFRRWDVELGGDLSAAQRIRLQNRDYTAFINGDAMGKSMQGAGGALVLGTVFKSILSRSEHSAAAAARSPERWLQDCFQQLHDVFRSFDGSMTATVVCGLIEEQRGVAYYVNAEHPRVVLYRDGRARFARDDEYIMPKLGMQGMAGLNKPFQINVLQLAARDVLLIGSDGRQDILIAPGESGEEDTMNEDEALFLRLVEDARGDLNGILDRTLETGTLADDVSILRAAYRQEEADDYHMPPPGYIHLKQKGKKYFQAGKYADACEAFEKALAFKDDDPEIYPYLATIYRANRRIKDSSRVYETLAWLVPSETEYLYIAAFGVRATYLLDGDVPLSRGIDFGERCRLRDRGHIMNLLNLAELYRLNSDYYEARAVLEEVLEIAPDNPRATRLSRSLYYKGSLHY